MALRHIGVAGFTSLAMTMPRAQSTPPARATTKSSTIPRRRREGKQPRAREGAHREIACEQQRSQRQTTSRNHQPARLRGSQMRADADQRRRVQDQELRGGSPELSAGGMRRERRERHAGGAHQASKDSEEESGAGHVGPLN